MRPVMGTSSVSPTSIQIVYRVKHENMAYTKIIFDYTVILMRHAWSGTSIMPKPCHNIPSGGKRGTVTIISS